jgi:hemoglobin
MRLLIFPPSSGCLRLGPLSPTVDELIEAFYVRVLADPLLAPFFQDTPLDRLRKMQKELFAMALGGPIA